MKVETFKLYLIGIFRIVLFLTITNAYATDPGLKFLENKNQWPSGIDYAAKVPGGRMYVNATGFSFYLLDENRIEELHEQEHHGFNEATGENIFTEQYIEGYFAEIKLVGAKQVSPVPLNKYTAYYNFFIGNDPSRWASRVQAYERIQYVGIYPGIDLHVYSSGNDAKYDYVIHPGADASLIQLNYSGFQQVCLQDGNLISYTTIGLFEETKPYAYQIINNQKIIVPAFYQLEGNNVSYSFPEGYDDCYDLIVDPLLIFSTYSGSTADNWGSTATPGEHGDLYSAGVTNLGGGGNFPASTGSFQMNYGGIYDIGILKYDSTGNELLYASYLGGTNSESPHSLVVDKDENLLVLGTTSSSDYPTSVDGFDITYNGGNLISHVIQYSTGSDLVITKLNKEGDALLASTFLGGTQNDGLNQNAAGQLVRNYGDQLSGDIITDEVGDVYISTVTSSSDFPVTSGLDLVYNGGISDALLLKLNSSLSSILWATFMGGSNADAAYTLQFDSNNDLVVAGGTSSMDFPTLPGVYQEVHAGQVDGWIARIKNDGSAILQSSFTGTNNL